ncbi:MAG TPA: hypothetical protein VMW37_00680 [Dehalococcoidales bacterium]|nr:hypothetical protein [Dehalococcoidales bacterium]
MAQNHQQVQGGNNNLHYETLVRLFSLGSQEFYNRFTAMVVTHTILLSGLIVGTGVFRDPNLDKSMKLATGIVALVGIVLCIIWWLLLHQSLSAQAFYRKAASDLETGLCFQIFSSSGWQPLGRGFLSIRVLSRLVIGLYIFLYILVILLITV